MPAPRWRKVERIVLILGLVAFAELGVFRVVYRDIWLLNRFIAQPNPQDFATLDRIYAATLRRPQESHHYEKLMKLVTAYNKVGDRSRVVTVCRRILEFDPENQKVRLVLADTLQAIGRYDEAAKEYERALGAKR